MEQLPVSALAPPPASAAAGRDVAVDLPRGFRLASGERLARTCVRARLQGAPDGPLVIVLGGISSHRFVGAAGAGKPGWWQSIVRAGGPVDLDRVNVLGLDFAPHGERGAPTITTFDQARLLALALDALGVERAHGLISASYGGMVGLAFAAAWPGRLGRLMVISAAHRAHPMATAWRGVQRRLLAFAAAAGRPEAGVALARELAMTTYRTPEEFAARFPTQAPPRAGDPYPVCDYLIARGRAYAETMSVQRWISLSDSMDRHAVEPGAVTAPAHVVAFASDRLVPPEDSRELARRLPRLAAFFELPSVYGHDAFLKEDEALAPIFNAFLGEMKP